MRDDASRDSMRGVLLKIICIIVGLAVSLAFSACCAYGFLASFEPGPHSLRWKVLYGFFGSVSIASTIWMIRAARRASRL